jgi:hypothetical protein
MDKPFTNIGSKSEYIRKKRNLTRAKFFKDLPQNYANSNFKTNFSAGRNKFKSFKNNAELLEQTMGLLDNLRNCKEPVVEISNAIIDCSNIRYTNSLNEGIYSVIDLDDLHTVSDEKAYKFGIPKNRGTVPTKNRKPKIYLKLHSKYR